MSGFLAGKIWQSDLRPELKPLAAALADIADHDGTSIYPSVAYLAWLLGRSNRAVQMGLARLRELEVIVVVRNGSGGRFKTTEYRMVETKLPRRPSWRNPELLAPFMGQKGELCEPKPRSLQQVSLNRISERVNSTSPDPLVEPSEDPPLNLAAPAEAAAASVDSGPKIPDWIPVSKWLDYVAMRKTIRRPLVKSAVALAIRKLFELKAEGHDLGDVLEQSVLNSWTGLFPVKQEKVFANTRINPSAEEQEQRIRENLRTLGLTNP
jgi:hypothetical protein